MKHITTKSKRLLLFLVSILWLVSCTPSLNVQTSYAPATDFKQFRTFAWYPSVAGDNLESKTGYDPQVDRRIKTAVEAELVKKGLKPNAEAPDILIAYDVALAAADPITSKALAPGFGYGYAYWYGYRYNYDVSSLPEARSIRDYPNGTLLIDLVAPWTNQLLWRGTAAAAEIEPTKTDESKIRGAISVILKQYTPAHAARAKK